eukprot:318516_1
MEQEQKDLNDYKTHSINDATHYYISHLIQSHIKNNSKFIKYSPNTSIINIYQANPTFQVNPDLKDIFDLPDILIWDPVQCFDLYSLCPNCNQPLVTRFKSAQKTSWKPRLVLNTDGIELLVSACYACVNDQCEFTYYNASSDEYLQILPLYVSHQLPVVITSKGSLTKEMYALSQCSIKNKMRINTFDAVIQTLCKQKWQNQQIIYCKWWKQNKAILTSRFVDGLWGTFENLKASEKHRFYYTELFKDGYLKKNDYYNYLFAVQKHCEIILADHTFKALKKLKVSFYNRFKRPFKCLYLTMCPRNKRILWARVCENAKW